jgi:hypothetical protein
VSPRKLSDEKGAKWTELSILVKIKCGSMLITMCNAGWFLMDYGRNTWLGAKREIRSTQTVSLGLISQEETRERLEAPKTLALQ